MNLVSLKKETPLPIGASRVRIAVSSCLLGEKVRFDGDHKRNTYIIKVLSAYFDFIPVCPEIAIGMGVPREPIHMVKTKQGLRAIGTWHPDFDVTDKLRQFGEAMAEGLNDIDGYILKQDSPSCGMERVRVHETDEIPSHVGVGIYAQAFMARRPWLPVEEEGCLSDSVLRENFFERIFVHHRWRQLWVEGITPAALMEFHTQHKFGVMAHSQGAYRRLGHLLTRVESEPIEALAAVYGSELMSALKRPTTQEGHTSVLMHLFRFLRLRIDPKDRAELLESIESYQRGLVPLVVPITLFKHHSQRQPNLYISKQYYLNPPPFELMLRNLI